MCISLGTGARGLHSMTLNTDATKIYLYGGLNVKDFRIGIYFGDLWVLPLSGSSPSLPLVWELVTLSAGSSSPGNIVDSFISDACTLTL
jgi:hypothetical protein